MEAPGREGGFVSIHRQVRSSRLYRSLTGEQKSVFFTLLILANWREDAVLNGGAWHKVARGELAHSLATIAEEAGVSIKVVRTTIAKLLVDDRPAGGRGSFLAERWTGTEAGTGLRILRVVNYDEYQGAGHDKGTPSGPEAGTAGARRGHGRGTAGAPREQVEQVEQVEQEEQEALPASAGPAEAAPVVLLSKPKPPPDPRHRPTIELFVRLYRELRGGEYRVDGPKDGAAVKRLLSWPEATDAEIETRVRIAFRDKFFRESNPTLAFFVSKWSSWAPVTGAAKAQRDWTKGRVGAEEIDPKGHEVGRQEARDVF